MPEKNPAGFERMKMPAIDFATYAREGNPHLGDGSIYPNHVVVFTGAAGKRRDEALALNHLILEAAGMANPDRANSECFTFRSLQETPYVAGVIVPRDQLDTCMRDADIEEMPNMVALQGKLVQAMKARNSDVAEAREAIAQMQAAKAEADANAKHTAAIGTDFLSRLFQKIDAGKQKVPAATR